MSKTFTLKAKMWIWPGDMAWHFVSLDKELSKSIRENYPKSAMVKIKASITSVDSEKVFVEKRSKILTENKKNKRNKNQDKNDKMEESEGLVLDWSTSLFRNKRDENYILPIKKDVRKKVGIYVGEVLEIKIEML